MTSPQLLPFNLHARANLCSSRASNLAAKPSSSSAGPLESTLTIIAATFLKEFKALLMGLRDSTVLSIDQLIIITMSIQGILCMGLRGWVLSLETHDAMVMMLS